MDGEGLRFALVVDDNVDGGVWACERCEGEFCDGFATAVVDDLAAFDGSNDTLVLAKGNRGGNEWRGERLIEAWGRRNGFIEAETWEGRITLLEAQTRRRKNRLVELETRRTLNVRRSVRGVRWKAHMHAMLHWWE